MAIRVLNSDTNLPLKVSFTDALKQKYHESDDEIVDNLIIDICYNSPKRKKENASTDFSFLRNVVLTRHNVGFAGIPSDGLKSLCPNVVDLDLSCNLIERWCDVLPILTELLSLKFVNLSHNSINSDIENKKYLMSWNKPQFMLESFALVNTGVAWADILVLCGYFPALKEIHVNNNGYDVLDGDTSSLRNLISINLGNNHLRSWSEIWKLKNLMNLKRLILSGNPLHDIFYDHPTQRGKSRDLNGNYYYHFSHRQEPHGRVKFMNSIHAHVALNDAKCKRNIFDRSFLSTAQDSNCIVDEENNKENVIGDLTADDIKSENIENNTNDFDKIFLITKGENFDYYSGKTFSFWVSFDTKTSYTNKMSRKNSRKSNKLYSTKCKDTNIHHQSLGNLVDGSSSYRMKKNSKNVSAFPTNELNLEVPNENDIVPFKELAYLCLSETYIANWSHLLLLRNFPSLRSLKIMDVELAKDEPQDEKRHLFIACLPTICCLNGSEICDDEREVSERFFLRYFSESVARPDNYSELEIKHGKLTPIADIDLGQGFKQWVHIKFVVECRVVKHAVIQVTKSIGVLRQYIKKSLLNSLNIDQFQMWHNPAGPGHKDRSTDLNELFLDSLPISRFDFLDGDEIHIVKME